MPGPKGRAARAGQSRVFFPGEVCQGIKEKNNKSVTSCNEKPQSQKHFPSCKPEIKTPVSAAEMFPFHLKHAAIARHPAPVAKQYVVSAVKRGSNKCFSKLQNDLNPTFPSRVHCF